MGRANNLINILAGTVVKTSGTAIVWGTDIDDTHGRHGPISLSQG